MAIYYDAPSLNFSTALATLVASRVIYPFALYQNTTAYVLEDDYIQNANDFSPLANNTLTNGLRLLEETPIEIVGGGLVRWTRRWGSVPSPFSFVAWDVTGFPQYYQDITVDAAFRTAFSRLAPITTTLTFSYTTTPAAITLSSEPLTITGTATLLASQWLDADTTPTVATYVAYVAASTAIVVKPNEIDRAYGVGNVWVQRAFTTPAQ